MVEYRHIFVLHKKKISSYNASNKVEFHKKLFYVFATNNLQYDKKQVKYSVTLWNNMSKLKYLGWHLLQTPY